MNSCRFAHVSDLHLPFEPVLAPLQRLSKRQLSAWSWQRRRELHSHQILDALVADLHAHAPDHYLITGDVINFSLPGEFEQAARWLRALAPPAQISLVPGNHDALVSVERNRGLGLWDAWTRVDGEWPFVHRVGAVSLIGLCSALPTAPLLARGELGAAQRARLAQQLQQEGAAGQIRLVMIHHPVAESAIRWRKALADQRELRALLREHGAELVLHGHARDSRFDALAGPAEAIPCLCVPSSSAVPSRHDEGARWHLMTVNPGPQPSVDVTVRKWQTETQSFQSAARYTLSLPSSVRQQLSHPERAA